TYLDINSEDGFNRAVFPDNGRGERDPGFACGEEDVGLGPNTTAPFNHRPIPATFSRIIGVLGIPLTFDNAVVGLPPCQLDLPAGGTIPYYLGAGATLDLLVAAHNVEESAGGVAKIEPRQKRPQAKLPKEIAFQRLGLVQPDDVVRQQ